MPTSLVAWPAWPGHTGLSVEHVHYLATSFKEKGFQKRQGNEGHDIPVLVSGGLVMLGPLCDGGEDWFIDLDFEDLDILTTIEVATVSLSQLSR